jgi:Putative beta-barrel porin-2, OmpL-like. bbp2
MVKVRELFNLRRRASAPQGAPFVASSQRGGVRKGLLMAAVVIGLGATYSHGVLADESMKDGGGCDPYKNYSCLDSYLGENVFERFYKYYKLEWGHGTAPADPKAPPSRVDGWPRTPDSSPPSAYSEWPTGALTSIGVTRPNSIDSPFMAAISNTDVGKWMASNNLQVYGWLNPGMNFSTNSGQKGANAPVAYTYSANTLQLDQAVVYLERLPDTVQKDHIDWGFRVSALYGADYRYTNSYGLGSYQFNKRNDENGYDFPMMYADIYIPYVLEGLEFRIGRYISIPDIEAQLAPNNLTYTHSLTYAWDNYTNTGIVGSLQITKQLMLQIGVDDGTETPIWRSGQKIPNLDPNNAIYSGNSFKKDPGNQPSLAACLRYSWNDGWDTLYPCIDGINDGKWGYNNIQWHGFTYYHRFNPEWALNFEAYYLDEHDVPNARNPAAVAIVNAGGTPFSPQFVPRNSSNLAYCPNTTDFTCSVWAVGVLGYLNYKPDVLNQFTLRLEWYDDPQGWRTGTGNSGVNGFTRYFDTAISWQHWLSPQIEFRPELSYWRSFSTAAFGGNPSEGIAGKNKDMGEFAADVIIHF